MTGDPTGDGRIDDVAGLCARCAHALVRPTRRGTVYLRCGLAGSDSRFARYPRLPVVRCAGFEPADPDQGSW